MGNSRARTFNNIPEQIEDPSPEPTATKMVTLPKKSPSLNPFKLVEAGD